MYEFTYRGYTILQNGMGYENIYFIVQDGKLDGGTSNLIDLIKKIDETWDVKATA